jgi:adenylosuccinate lyase
VAYPHRLEKIWEPLLKKTWGYTLFPDHTNRTLRSLCSIFDALKRINTIIIDLDRDIWTYVSMEYFKQSVGLADGKVWHFEHLSAKLPLSRLRLTDSTVLRNIGVPMGHTLIGFESTLKGLNKLLLNEPKFHEDLEKNGL